jgi:hypothetical protein
MGHAQPATPLLGGNNFAIGLGSDTIKQRRSKSIDMPFHWLRGRIRQSQFVMHYLATDLLLADFFNDDIANKSPSSHNAKVSTCAKNISCNAYLR